MEELSYSFMPANQKAVLDFRRSYLFPKDINLSRLDDFISDLSRDRKVLLSGIAVMKDGKLLAEHYVAPYSGAYRHVSYSMCKSVTQMAIGLAVSEGKLSLDEKVSDIFPEYKIPFFHREMKEVTVRHLLTMTSGVKFDEFSSSFSKDWCKSFLSSELEYKPGDKFSYNSLNTYMLAAIIHRKTQKSVLEYLKPRLLEPLNIKDITWDLCPRGIERGGWGMKLSLLDMLKFGQLYLSQGAYMVDGIKRQLLPKDWVKASVKCHVSFHNRPLIKGYGYQIWLLKDGAYLFNGVFGQNVYIHPEKKLVIACTARAYEVFPDGHLMEKICGFVADSDNFRPRYVASILDKAQKSFSKYFRPPARRYELDHLRPYLDRTYQLQGYASSLLPTASQLIYSNYMTGITRFHMKCKNDKLYIQFEDSDERFLLQAGYKTAGDYRYQILTFKGKEMPVAVRAKMKKDTLGRTILLLDIVYLEETVNKKLAFCFCNNDVVLKAMASPNMVRFLHKLYGEPLMHRTKRLGILGSIDKIDEKLKEILFPKCFGSIQEKS